MDDLISRQAAIDAINCDITITGRQNAELVAATIGSFADRIKALPSAQPEIIRCGDCKWFQCNMRPDGYLPKGVEEFECRHWCGTCDPTDFCSMAERREVTT